jgi:tRNA U34 5-methylaminomethyl-2-thiouridine-forming methyltransferase MnmC
VNPIFEYENIQATQKTMQNFNMVSFKHFQLAKDILEIVLNKFGSEKQWQEQFGEVLE